MTDKRTLPIDAFESQIVDSVRANPVTIIAAETGAGKSTTVPLMLLRAGLASRGQIGVTQPRRVAAIGVSEWVAELHGSPIGDVIGYQIRAERKATKATKVKFMTEGILLRELHHDPSLKHYSVVVVDEAHERGVNQDLILALLKKVRAKRPDLKIVVMSATIDEHRFSTYFGGAPVIKVPGRVFPVEVRYEKDDPSPEEMPRAVTDKVVQVLMSDEPGDILAFLPDEQMIKRACQMIELAAPASSVRVLPLYGAQAPDEQREVFKRDDKRRVIVSTNIAETSLTIDGVRHVIDSGLIKAMVYVNASMSALRVTNHSKAGCDQRKGRAGRTQDGICHRLFSKEGFEDRDGFTQPEILRMSLDQVLLHLRCLDYSFQDILDLEFMDAPGEDRWREAEERLKTLGALDSNGDVTADGRRMEKFPAAPMLARMLLKAEAFGCVREAATVVAALTSRSVYIRPKGKESEADSHHASFRNPGSDALTLLRVIEEWEKQSKSKGWARDRYLSTKALAQVDQNREHLLDILRKEGIEITSSKDKDKVRKAIAAGLLVNLARNSGRYYMWQGQMIYIHPGSVMFKSNPEFMVCAEVVQTTKAYARGCDAVERQWLPELIPETALDRQYRIESSWYGESKLVEVVQWNEMELSRTEIEEIPEGGERSIAAQLAENATKPFGQSPHPDIPAIRAAWDIVSEACRWNDWGLSTMQAAKRDEAKERLAASLASQLAGKRTLEQILATSLSMVTTDFAPEEALADHLARLESEAAERRALVAAREEEERTAAKIREEKLAPLRERHAALAARVAAIPDSVSEKRNLLSNISALTWRLNDAWYSDSVYSALTGLEAEISAAERKAKEFFDMHQKAVDVALAAFPKCPFCSGAWSADLVCSNAAQHNPDRLVGGRVIATVETERCEVAAFLTLSDGAVCFSFPMSRRNVWQGKKFKDVACRHKATVLPPDLTPAKEVVLGDLTAVAELAKSLSSQETAVRSLEALHGSASRKLTFREKDGRAIAIDGDTTYVAEYGSHYPQDGETWVCLTGKVTEAVGIREASAKPLFQITITSADVEDMKALVLETYPGLPQHVFDHVGA